METKFNFIDKKTEFIYSLHPKSEIILHIKRINNSIATLYFTNQLNEPIEIPAYFFIIYQKKILEKNIDKEDFTLYHRNNYDIEYIGETLFNIRNERTWTIYN